VRIACWLLAGALLAGAAPNPPGALDKAVLEKYLRNLELFRGDVMFKIDNPVPAKYLPGYYEVLVHLVFGDSEKDEVFYVSANGQTIVRGDAFNLHKSPFQSNLDKLNLQGQPSFGPADAAVTIVEFGDFECPDCKAEAPILRQNVPETFDGKVRVVFQNYPLESIHPWALAAAVSGRCVYRQGNDAFWKFYDWIYENQDAIMPDNLNMKVLDWAGKNGIDTLQLGQCMDTQATLPEVKQSIAEALELGAPGTPTLFINGRRIGGLAFPDLQLVINRALEYAASNPAAPGSAKPPGAKSSSR
jgi:protein-disulfide isomerase